VLHLSVSYFVMLYLLQCGPLFYIIHNTFYPVRDTIHHGSLNIQAVNLKNAGKTAVFMLLYFIE